MVKKEYVYNLRQLVSHCQQREMFLPQQTEQSSSKLCSIIFCPDAHTKPLMFSSKIITTLTAGRFYCNIDHEKIIQPIYL